jgi:DNA polymerase III subunit epsilon
MKTFVQLERPIIWFDVETANFAPQPEDARICELGFQVIYHDDRPDYVYNSLVNPEIPIEPGATEVHGITDEDVRERPTFKQIAGGLVKGFRDCDYGGYNVRFDVRVMTGEMKRAGHDWSYAGAYLVDPFEIWRQKQRRRLTDAVREFLGREPSGAHRAVSDAKDALEILTGQLQRWPDLPRTVRELHEFAFPVDPNSVDPAGKFRWSGDVCLATFGKWNNVPIEKIARSYLEWMVRDGNFEPGTKKVAIDALNGVFPKRS